MFDRLNAALSEDARAFLKEAKARGVDGLSAILPALARRMGRTPLGGGLHRIEVADGRAVVIDLDQLRLCDAAGMELLEHTAPTDAQRVDLYLAGDMEERTIVLRSIAIRPITDATLRLLEEVQRTNVESHFIACALDSNLAIRAREHGAFDEAAFNRLMLKAAFLGLPLERMKEATDGANPELSRMLQDLATEREAAGRGVWADTCRMVGHAPTAGSIARIVGGLEHGDDRLRLSAALAVGLLPKGAYADLIKERVAREPRPEIRAALERALA